MNSWCGWDRNGIVEPGNSVRTEFAHRTRGIGRRNLPHRRQYVGLRRDRRDELLDLALGLVRRARENLVGVRVREVRYELADPARVQPAIAQHHEQGGIPPRSSRDGDSRIRLVLREVQHLRAIGEHRGGLVDVRPALVHFGDVGDENGFDASRLAHELSETAEEIGVGKALQFVRARHSHTVPRSFLASRLRRVRRKMGRDRGSAASACSSRRSSTFRAFQRHTSDTRELDATSS